MAHACRLAILGVSILGAACSKGTLALEAPLEALARESWILWVDGQMVASNAETIRLEPESDREGAELVLLAYAQTLGDLGIAAGELPSGVRCRACALIQTPLAWTHQTDAGEEAWLRLEALPSAMRESLIPDDERCDLCRPFLKGERLADEPPNPFALPAFVTPWADGQLVAYRDGTFRQLEPTRSASDPPVPACVPDPSFKPLVAYRATETVVWLVDAANLVFRLDLDQLQPDRSCLDAATLSSTVAWSGPLLWALTGPSSAAPSELYGAALELEPPRTLISRFLMEGRTEVLGELSGTDNDLAAASRAPGDFVVVNGSTEVFRWQDGVARIHGVETNGVNIFTSYVTHHPTRGYLFGTSNTLVVVEDGMGGHDYLAPFENSAQRVQSIVPYGDGLVVGERNGTYRRYFDGVGYCPISRGFGNQLVKHLAVGPRGELLGGDARLYYELPADDGCAP